MWQRRLFAVQHRRDRHLPGYLSSAGCRPFLSQQSRFTFYMRMTMDVRREEVKARPEQPSLSKERARQGSTGHNVRYVLGFGLAGVIILFAVVYLFYFGH
jgi:hypothetical protein